MVLSAVKQRVKTHRFASRLHTTFTLCILPGLIMWVNGPTSGTFAGTIDLFLGYNIITVAADCGLATGLSTLPVNSLGGDNLMVGPAF